MNLIDGIILLVLFANIAFGFWRGLVSRLVGLVALYVGFVLATDTYQAVAQFIEGAFGSKAWNPTVVGVLTFIILFIIIVTIIQSIAMALLGKLEFGFLLSGLDHVLGALAGLAIGVVETAFGLVIVQSLLKLPGALAIPHIVQLNADYHQSALVPIFLVIMPSLYSAVRPLIPGAPPALFTSPS